MNSYLIKKKTQNSTTCCTAKTHLNYKKKVTHNELRL